MSTHLITLAEEMLRTLRQPIGGDSDAAADLRDTSLDAEWGRPLFQYVHRSAPLVISVHDHIRATGALILADRVVQAPMTVMRSALEGLSLMYWLYEPGIDAQEKARRHINLRLMRSADGLNQILALGDRAKEFTTASEPQIILDGVRASKHLIRGRWTPPSYNERGNYWRAGHIGTRVPTITRRLRSMQLLSEGADDALAGYLYARLSAVAHAGELGLSGYLTPLDAGADGVVETVVSLSVTDLAWQSMPLLLAANATVHRVARYIGVDVTRWHQEWASAALYWRELVPAAGSRGGEAPGR